MKRYIILLMVIALFACKANGQTTKAKALNSTQWYYGDDSDYSLAITGDSTLTYTITLNKPDDVLYDVQVTLDSVGGTPSYVMDLKGRVFTDDTWSDLETDVTWYGTSTDTTILFQEHSTAVFYRQIQLQVNGQAATGAASVDKVEVKIWP
jgi:hypothetical protein